MNLAACCDMRYCNEGARFGVPAAKLGLGYGFLRIERLSRIVGLSRAMEFLFTAKQYSVEGGLRHGPGERRGAPTPSSTPWSARSPAPSRQNAPLTIALAKAAAREIAKPESKQDHKKPGEDGGSLLRQRGLRGRPPGLHGEEEAGVSRDVSAGSAPLQWRVMP